MAPLCGIGFQIEELGPDGQSSLTPFRTDATVITSASAFLFVASPARAPQHRRFIHTGVDDFAPKRRATDTQPRAVFVHSSMRGSRRSVGRGALRRPESQI